MINKTQILRKPDDPLEVSIPIGEPSSDTLQKSALFLLFQLDLTSYRHTTDLIGFLCATCIGLLSVLIATALAVRVERIEELHTAFDRVERVLWDSPTPYLLLDSSDNIVHYNAALETLFECEQSALIGKKFRDFIDDKNEYDKVQEKRRSGNHNIEHYELHLLPDKHGDHPKKIWITSAAVPKLSYGESGDLPNTFGILLTKKPTAPRVQPIRPSPGHHNKLNIHKEHKPKHRH